MSKAARATVVVDLPIKDDETLAGVVADFTAGLAQNDSDSGRVLSLEVHEVEDAQDMPYIGPRCTCMDVIG